MSPVRANSRAIERSLSMPPTSGMRRLAQYRRWLAGFEPRTGALPETMTIAIGDRNCPPARQRPRAIRDCTRYGVFQLEQEQGDQAGKISAYDTAARSKRLSSRFPI